MRTVVMLLVLTLLGVFWAADSSHAQNKIRFQEIYDESKPNAQNDSSANDSLNFRVFHDNETGQEIVCAEGPINRWNRVDSCYLTGRKW